MYICIYIYSKDDGTLGLAALDGVDPHHVVVCKFGALGAHVLAVAALVVRAEEGEASGVEHRRNVAHHECDEHQQGRDLELDRHPADLLGEARARPLGDGEVLRNQLLGKDALDHHRD